MKKYIITCILYILTATSLSYATGVMLPVSTSYPKDFLRLHSTEVTVNINGIVAETLVYQEFENEWTDSTSVVYSYPLPQDARATEFVYWYNDTAYTAVLKVKEQATNPGTGDGGIAGQVNAYIGRNGISILLKGVKAGAIQKVRIRYISVCDYFQGKCTYNFPLNTSAFVPYPVDNVTFNFNVNANTAISSFGIPGFTGYTSSQASPNSLRLVLNKSKMYLDQDLTFNYNTSISSMGVDFYSIANDTVDGHFVLFIRPEDQAIPDSTLTKKVVFLVSNNTLLQGVMFDALKTAVSKSLDMLKSTDYFDLVISNYYTTKWNSTLVKASAENILSAKTYLTSITTTSGSNLQDAVTQSLGLLTDTSFSNSILIFSESGANLDPLKIETLNTSKVGIFPIGIGDQVSRARLEMTAAHNYGFTTYITTNDNLSDKMLRVFSQINKPLLTNVAYEYGSSNISQVVPAKIPSTYAGSAFFMAGRYKNSGISPLSIAGYSVNGFQAYDFKLNFSAQNSGYKFVESLWAKQMIDALEWQIEIYGETAALKQQLIDLSLRYNIRCRYTAYIADYKTTATGVKEKDNVALPKSYIMGNYPNPFNPSTSIRFYLDNNSVGKLKLLKIYNILGKLVAVIDVTNLSSGWHETFFNGRDTYGNALPSGIYLAQLQVGDKVVNTIRMNLIK